MNTKLSDVMLILADEHQDDPSFGKTRLFKELFWADAFHYGMFGSSITGCTYRKLANGPVPEDGMAAFDHLIQSGRASVRLAATPVGPRHQLVAQPGSRIPLDPTELGVLKDVASWLRGASARAVSDHSHEVSPWRWAEDGGSIDLDMIFVDANWTPSDTWIARAQARLIEEGIVAIQDR